MKKVLLGVFSILLGGISMAQTTDLLISEYAEGSSNNKYIEIYNGTGDSVNLANYQLRRISNGGVWSENIIPLSGWLYNNEVLVVANSSADTAILNLPNATTAYNSATFFNGDDAVGLAKDTGSGSFIMIDAVGEQGPDPGSGWDVAGVTDATAEHTLVRKMSVCSPDTNWGLTAGVDSASSQWLVKPQNFWDSAGFHSVNCSSTGGGGGTTTAPTYSIATITTQDTAGMPDSIGVECWIEGVVLGVDLDGNAGYSFTLWNNDGINIFSFVDVNSYVVTEGDSLKIMGTVGQYNGLTQFSPDSIVLVNQGNTIPAPTVVTSLAEAQESELVRIENFWVDDISGLNHVLTNGTDTVVMRLDTDTDVPANVTFAVGDTICYVIGIGGQFDPTAPYFDGYQFFPQRAADVDNSCGSLPPPVVPFYPIPEINNVDVNGESDSLGVYCWTKGVVLGIDLDGNAGISFTIFDEEGINVYNYADVSNYVVTEGDSIMVRGEIDQYNGLTEIFPDSIVLLNQGNTLPMTHTVTSLGEETESAPIRVVNVSVIDASEWGDGNGSFNVRLLTCGGDTIVMRADSDTDVGDSISAAPSGMFTVSGIGGQYDNSSPYFDGYQIFPMSYMDIDTTTDYSTPMLYVNEIMSDNDSVIMDDMGEYDDWAELYNPGTEDIMLAGLFMTDDAAEPMKYMVPTTNMDVVPAGGYALIWCDSDEDQGDLHTNFSLSASGEYFGVTSYDGCAMIDGFDFPALDTDVSYGRKTDGNDTLVTFPTWSTTPNAMNMLDTVNGVGEVDYANNQLVVYPNPSNGNAVVRFNETISFEVYDVLGNLVAVGIETKELNVAEFNTGVYLVRANNGEVVRMIVK